MTYLEKDVSPLILPVNLDLSLWLALHLCESPLRVPRLYPGTYNSLVSQNSSIGH